MESVTADDHLRTDSSVGAIADPGAALFSYDERYIDVQGAWQEDRRGIITFAFIGAMYLLQYMALFGNVVPGIKDMMSGFDPLGRPLTAEGYIFIPLFILMWVVANVVFFRFAWRWLRLEIFVQRRIVVRFNRITKQVHLNRPAYAGGVVTFPWEATIADMVGGDGRSRNQGGTLLLAWPSHYSGAGFDDLCIVGGAVENRQQAEALWEYIRRYMEEGSDAAPRPARLRALFPWPWDSVRSTLSFLVPSWRTGDKGFVLTFALILSPLLLLHSICHWLSLLLCRPTRWSGIIKSAGLPGAAVPRLTVAEDFGVEVARKLRASTIKVVDEPDDPAGLHRAKSSSEFDSE
jgi:hypothetical protein